jgi:thiamine pyrophosphokinase
VENESSFDGLMSTSNHLVPGQNVWIKTTHPIWWTVELKPQIKAKEEDL